MAIKRPDGLTLLPWQIDGRCATWDVTVTDTVVASYVGISSSCAASAAEAAAKRKEEKYIEICQTHNFFPIAFETFSPINQVDLEFISALGQRLTRITDDPVSLLSSSNVSQSLFSASMEFALLTHLAIFTINLLTIRDTLRALISFK